MTQIIVLPHVEVCPDGAVIEAREGESICQNLLENGIAIEHACEMSCACTTCHGLEPNSRLSCQAIVNETPLVIEIPRYSINMTREGKH